MATRQKLTRASASDNTLALVDNINKNWALLEEYLEETLLRVEDIPNHMQTDLDMNGNDIYNVGNIYEGTPPGSAGGGSTNGPPPEYVPPNNAPSVPCDWKIVKVLGAAYQVNSYDNRAMVLTYLDTPYSSGNTVVINLPPEDTDGVISPEYPEGFHFVVKMMGEAKPFITYNGATVKVYQPQGSQPAPRIKYSEIIITKIGYNAWGIGGDFMSDSIPDAPVAPSPPATPTPPATPALPTLFIPNAQKYEHRHVQVLTNGNVIIMSNAGVQTVIATLPAGTEVWAEHIRGDTERGDSFSFSEWFPITAQPYWIVEDSTSTRWMEIRLWARNTGTSPTQTSGLLYVNRNAA